MEVVGSNSLPEADWASFFKLNNEPYDSSKLSSLALRLGNDRSNYSNMELAGRILIYDIVRTSGNNIERYVRTFSRRLSPKISEFYLQHAERLSAELKSRESKNYENYDYFSAFTRIRSYLLRPTYGEEPRETPEQSLLRTAVQLYHDQGVERVLQCYREMSDRWYIHASPTQFNAGTKIPQLASCFLVMIDDDLKSILKTGVYEVGEISKMNGGIGYNVSRLRDSEIGDVGHSADILGHLRIYDATIKDVNQGGKRDGAATIFLRPHHKNIRSFVRSTDNYTNHELRLGKVNTCLWMSRLFFKRVEKKENWTVFCPAKASSLNGLYGYDFELEYCRLEKEALLREEEFQEAKKAYDELKIEYLRNPDNLELEKRLDEALEKKIQSKKRRINHEVLDASELYDEICSVQMRSGMPYICHGDAGNDKSNQKNIGTIDGSNLCLEIFEVSTPDSIASCNLVSLNMVTPVKGALPFPGKISEISTPEGNKDTVITEVVANPEDIRQVYDFNLLGKASQSGIFNIEEVIDKNFYPLDKHDAEGNVLKRGKISRPNFDNRPIGMGISGFDDALKKMNLGVSDVRAELFNKMAFACIYFNALVASLKLAIERGPYPNFRTGSYKKYLGTILNEEGKKIPLYEVKEGSPLSNGQFQFDLWAETAQQLYDMGDLDVRVYDRNDDIPIEPSTWGQEPIIIEHGEINLVIEPTWDSLRQAILEHGVRNSLLIALMPTASTAHILRNAESTEGHQGNIYVKEGKDWSCTVIVRWLVDDLNSLCSQVGLGEIKLWNQNLADFIAACHGTVKYIKNFMTDFPQYFPSEIFDNGKLKEEISKGLDWIIFKYKTIYEVSQKVHIRYARQRGIYICQSQSLNIYLEAPTQKQLRALHSYTNKMGIKTGMYYLRQSEATKIAKLTLDPEIAKYHRNLMERMGIHHLSNVAEARQESSQEETPAPVCRREAGCVSCN